MNKGVALYIHIPFCKQKCLYCDFPSFPGKENKMLDYAKALSKEINKLNDKKINTIFIGGGTPTYLSLEGWKILKKSIEKLNVDKNVEFTVEGNPGTFNKEKLIFLKNMGVNRLSIGLQAWQNKHLKALGRIHEVEDFIESFNLARSIGFNNINVDLMFGLPNQSLDEWKETLENVVSMSPEHISCYSLIVEKGTKFYNLYEKDELHLPKEDIERGMYNYTLKFLANKNYHQYEISNFSKENKECIHNLVYWDVEDYIGCGASAHSYENSFRYNNVQNIDDYIFKMEKDISPIENKNKNSKKNDMEEFMFMGLRKIKGVSIEKFNKKFKIPIGTVYSEVIDKYKRQNLLIEEDGNLFLSPKGIELSNMIMSDFLLDI